MAYKDSPLMGIIYLYGCTNNRVKIMKQNFMCFLEERQLHFAIDL